MLLAGQIEPLNVEVAKLLAGALIVNSTEDRELPCG